MGTYPPPPPPRPKSTTDDGTLKIPNFMEDVLKEYNTVFLAAEYSVPSCHGDCLKIFIPITEIFSVSVGQPILSIPTFISDKLAIVVGVHGAVYSSHLVLENTLENRETLETIALSIAKYVVYAKQKKG